MAKDDRKKYRVSINGTERVLLLSAEDAAEHKYAKPVEEAKGRRAPATKAVSDPANK